MSDYVAAERPPGRKLLFAILIGALLAVPLFAIYLLVYDRQSQSETARSSIAEGWGGPQTIAGPVLIIPYSEQVSETVNEAGKQVVRTNTVWRELTVSPSVADIKSDLKPERRHRSIYDAVVYEAHNTGTAKFALPADLKRFGVTIEQLALDRAELRFGLRDARGLFGPPPSVTIEGRRLPLQPGNGPAETEGSGFFTWLDAAALRERPIAVSFDYAFRGNGWLALQPQAGDTRWTVSSKWPHPSFTGGFLPTTHKVDDSGFSATWRVGNLALGSALVAGDLRAKAVEKPYERRTAAQLQAAGDYEARVDLVTPVDLYSQVNRSVKYGFLFIGFTFIAFLMFDVIGGVRVTAVEYLLVGAGLVLFFIMLLAFAEVIGFSLAYILAASAIISLLTAYSSAVLGSWRRGAMIAGLLTALYGVLYILLSLEAYSLLIGSLLLFAALAAVMYLTRGLDWSSARRLIDQAP
ncbi:cell envelope integrity protein CreD [Sphingomonas sp. So64.6b]|uniref:cell envelope integrity protein CreD n=1 Tax=Sphingomonas sp. So64.6b TaxID=2997354 RepID=UPI001600A0B6|nr:cell envelope integrity protein CreD [Sphingomonas sp. So64.6b]QNA83027.1 cell envelope integrity protein CreD [Sphingomonas sp. So64.6b]